MFRRAGGKKKANAQGYGDEHRGITSKKKGGGVWGEKNISEGEYNPSERNKGGEPAEKKKR